jgi:hypothetical protein
MNPLYKQTEIMEKIAQILHEEADYKYEKVTGNFNFSGGYRGSAAITIHITREGKDLNPGISDNNIFEANNLAVELRAAMKAHTDGEWDSFTLTLDADGKAHTKFHYPEKN